MAQPQTQAKKTSSFDSRGTANVPSTHTGGRQLMPNDSSAWATSPFGLMRRLTEDMDQLFGQFLGGGVGGRSLLNGPVLFGPPVQWIPDLEVFERDGKLVIQTDLPGLQANDVSVEVSDGLVTISGERREQQEIDEGGFRRTERRYGRFSRSIALPDGVRAEEVQATFRNGVLELVVPLPESAPERRKVDVKSEVRSDAEATDGGTSDSNAGAGRVNNGGPAAGKTAGEQVR